MIKKNLKKFKQMSHLCHYSIFSMPMQERSSAGQ